MRKLIISILAAFLLSFAQQSMDLVDLWHQADSTNYDIRRMEQNIHIRELEKSGKKSSWGPKLGIYMAYQYQSEAFRITVPNTGMSIPIMQNDNYFNHIWLDWTLFEGMKRFYEVDSRQYAIESRSAQRKFVSETIKHQLSRLSLMSGLLEKQNRILNESKARIQINLDQSKLLWQEGQISSADTLEFWQGILEIEKQKTELEKQRQDLFEEIGFLSGYANAIKAVFPAHAESIPRDLLQLGNRADQRALELEEKEIQSDYSALGGTYWPKISAKADWRYNKPGYDPISNEWVSYGTFDIGLTWVLWDWNLRKIGREQIEVRRIDNHIRHSRLETDRKKELNKLNNEADEIENKSKLTAKQLQLKKEYYRHRKEQYQMSQIDANQLSITENELTILELQYQVLQMKKTVNLVDQMYVCGTFGRWTQIVEDNQ